MPRVNHFSGLIYRTFMVWLCVVTTTKCQSLEKSMIYTYERGRPFYCTFGTIDAVQGLNGALQQDCFARHQDMVYCLSDGTPTFPFLKYGTPGGIVLKCPTDVANGVIDPQCILFVHSTCNVTCAPGFRPVGSTATPSAVQTQTATITCNLKKPFTNVTVAWSHPQPCVPADKSHSRRNETASIMEIATVQRIDIKWFILATTISVIILVVVVVGIVMVLRKCIKCNPRCQRRSKKEVSLTMSHIEDRVLLSDQGTPQVQGSSSSQCSSQLSMQASVQEVLLRQEPPQEPRSQELQGSPPCEESPPAQGPVSAQGASPLHGLFPFEPPPSLQGSLSSLGADSAQRSPLSYEFSSLGSVITQNPPQDPLIQESVPLLGSSPLNGPVQETRLSSENMLPPLTDSGNLGFQSVGSNELLQNLHRPSGEYGEKGLSDKHFKSYPSHCEILIQGAFAPSLEDSCYGAAYEKDRNMAALVSPSTDNNPSMLEETNISKEKKKTSTDIRNVPYSSGCRTNVKRLKEIKIADYKNLQVEIEPQQRKSPCLTLEGYILQSPKQWKRLGFESKKEYEFQRDKHQANTYSDFLGFLLDLMAGHGDTIPNLLDYFEKKNLMAKDLILKIHECDSCDKRYNTSHR